MAQKLRIEYVQFYTDGSAAKKVDVKPVEQKEFDPIVFAPPVPYKRKKVFIDPVAILGMLVAICMFFTITVGIIELRNAQIERYQMEQYVLHLSEIHTQRQEAFRAAYDMEEVDRTARALGMVPASEVSHKTIDMTLPVVEAEPTLLESAGTFLAGLFA